MERLTVPLVLAVLAFAPLVLPTPAIAAEPGDAVVGAGSAVVEGERWTFRVDAEATADGIDGRLNVTVHTRGPGTEQFRVDVQCLIVSEDVAFVGGATRRPDRYEAPYLYSHIVLVVQDNAPSIDAFSTNRFINWPDRKDPSAYTTRVLPDPHLFPLDSGDVLVTDRT